MVFSRPRETTPSQQSLENALVDGIYARWGLQVLCVPELYDLRPHGRTVGRLRNLSGPVVVLHRFSEKATYWLLQKLDIPGSLFSLSEEGGYFDSEHPRPIACISTDSNSEQAILSQLGSVLGYSEFCDAESLVPPSEKLETVKKRSEVHEPTTRRWYPIIDRSRCEACLECLNFCLFGVYSLDEQDMPLVDQPDACRHGCPACSRICPTGAILFPEHEDPVISGRREEAPEAFEDSGQSGQRLAAENERYSAFEQKPIYPPGPPSSDSASGDDDLDDLIDRIEGMDL